MKKFKQENKPRKRRGGILNTTSLATMSSSAKKFLATAQAFK